MLNDALTKLIHDLRKATTATLETAHDELERWQAVGRKGDIADVLVSQGELTTPMARRLRLIAAKKFGPRVPGYELVEPLGGGGMGLVYAARQLGLDRIVALKVLAPDLVADPESVKRFMREARAAGRLDHPNIVKAYDVSPGDRAKGVPPYIVMEFIRGETLHSLLGRKGHLSEKHALQIGSAVAAALDHAHTAGLVHRDVKPDNIMLTAGGGVKLCDLGLAKPIDQGQTLTQGGLTHGTPHFMSPEQARGRRRIDTRSDLYALGCTLYRTAVGKTPFTGNTAVEVLVDHLEKRPPSPRSIRPGLSLFFERIVLKLLEKNPANRYQFPRHLQTDLELVLSGERPRIDYGIPYRAPEPTAAAPATTPADAPPLDFASSSSSAVSVPATPDHPIPTERPGPRPRPGQTPSGTSARRRQPAPADRPAEPIRARVSSALRGTPGYLAARIPHLILLAAILTGAVYLTADDGDTPDPDQHDTTRDPSSQPETGAGGPTPPTVAELGAEAESRRRRAGDALAATRATREASEEARRAYERGVHDLLPTPAAIPNSG